MCTRPCRASSRSSRRPRTRHLRNNNQIIIGHAATLTRSVLSFAGQQQMDGAARTIDVEQLAVPIDLAVAPLANVLRRDVKGVRA
jgi:hypothetical protein